MTFVIAAFRLASLRGERDDHRKTCSLSAERCAQCAAFRIWIAAAKRDLQEAR